MKTFYKENEVSNTSLITYLGLVNKPTIESLVLEGNLSADDIKTYNIPTVERLINNAKKMNIVSELPEDPEKNTLYYVGTSIPYDLYVYDNDLNLIFLGKSASQSFTTNSEGISITGSGSNKLLEVYYDPGTFKINAEGKLVSKTIDAGKGLLLKDNQLLDIDFDDRFKEEFYEPIGYNIDPDSKNYGIYRIFSRYSPTGMAYDTIAEARYIDGNDYVPNLYHPTVNTSVKFRASFYNWTDDYYHTNAEQIIGDDSTGWRLVYFRRGNDFITRFDLEGEGQELVNVLQPGNVYTIEVGNYYIKIDDVTVGRWAPKGFDSPRETPIMVFKNANYAQLPVGIKWIEIYEDGEIVDRLVPVATEEAPNGKDGFYSHYTGNFYPCDGVWSPGLATLDGDDAPRHIINWGAGYYLDMMPWLGNDRNNNVRYCGMVTAPPKKSANAYLRADGLWDDMTNDAMIGEIRAFAGTEVPLGWLLCDGSLVRKDKYPALLNAIKNIYELGQNVDNPTPSPVPTGPLGPYSSDYFALPDLRQRFVVGAELPDVVGTPSLPKAPNVYAEITFNTSKQYRGGYLYGDGPFYGPSWGNKDIRVGQDTSVNGTDRANFDMSLMSDIYGKANTVQPEAVVMNYIIKY